MTDASYDPNAPQNQSILGRFWNNLVGGAGAVPGASLGDQVPGGAHDMGPVFNPLTRAAGGAYDNIYGAIRRGAPALGVAPAPNPGTPPGTTGTVAMNSGLPKMTIGGYDPYSGAPLPFQPPPPSFGPAARAAPAAIRPPGNLGRGAGPGGYVPQKYPGDGWDISPDGSVTPNFGGGGSAPQMNQMRAQAPMQGMLGQQPGSPFTMVLRPNAPAEGGGRGGGGTPLGTALNLSGMFGGQPQPQAAPAPPQPIYRHPAPAPAPVAPAQRQPIPANQIPGYALTTQSGGNGQPWSFSNLIGKPDTPSKKAQTIWDAYRVNSANAY